MRTTFDRLARMLLPVAVGAGCMIALLAAMNAMADHTNVRPHIGDIVSFTPSAGEPDKPAIRLIAHRSGQPACVVDLGSLRRTGGSFVIEGEASGGEGNYRVHWAGERTASGAGNCGDGTDLLLSVADMDLLASFAGGYGPVEKLQTRPISNFQK